VVADHSQTIVLLPAPRPPAKTKRRARTVDVPAADVRR
jgi:hypothetical protein